MVDSSDEKIDRRTYTAPIAHIHLLYARGIVREEVKTGARSTSTLLEEIMRYEHGSVSRHRGSPHTVMDVKGSCPHVIASLTKVLQSTSVSVRSSEALRQCRIAVSTCNNNDIGS